MVVVVLFALMLAWTPASIRATAALANTDMPVELRAPPDGGRFG
jgi:hypothetical protein